MENVKQKKGKVKVHLTVAPFLLCVNTNVKKKKKYDFVRPALMFWTGPRDR